MGWTYTRSQSKGVLYSEDCHGEPIPDGIGIKSKFTRDSSAIHEESHIYNTSALACHGLWL